MEVLGQSKEKYQNLVETLPLMVLQLDAEGKIIFLNTAVERISGYTAAELQHPGFWESLLEEDDRWQFQTARMPHPVRLPCPRRVPLPGQGRFDSRSAMP